MPVLPVIGPVAAVFDFVPPPWHLTAAMILIVVRYVLATELAKASAFARSRDRVRAG